MANNDINILDYHLFHSGNKYFMIKFVIIKRSTKDKPILSHLVKRPLIKLGPYDDSTRTNRIGQYIDSGATSVTGR